MSLVAGRVALRPRGAWNAQTNYTNLDMVSKSGAYYVAKQASLNKDPSTVEGAQYWDKMIEGGGGGGSTVAITPTLQSGTKIADYTIDGVAGALYAPSGGGGSSSGCPNFAYLYNNDPEQYVQLPGVDWDFTEDGVLILDGELEAEGLIMFFTTEYYLEYLRGRTLRLKACPEGGSVQTYVAAILYQVESSPDMQQVYDTGEGATLLVPADCISIQVVFHAEAGVSFSDTIISPILCFAEDYTGTYMPPLVPEWAAVWTFIPYEYFENTVNGLRADIDNLQNVNDVMYNQVYSDILGANTGPYHDGWSATIDGVDFEIDTYSMVSGTNVGQYFKIRMFGAPEARYPVYTLFGTENNFTLFKAEHRYLVTVWVEGENQPNFPALLNDSCGLVIECYSSLGSKLGTYACRPGLTQFPVPLNTAYSVVYLKSDMRALMESGLDVDCAVKYRVQEVYDTVEFNGELYDDPMTLLHDIAVYLNQQNTP